MIDRLNLTVNPIQPRMPFNEEQGVRPNKVEQSNKSSNQAGEQSSQNSDKKKVEEVVKGLNNFLEPTHTSLKFKLHERLNEYYAVIVDDNTNEVIQEIPAKKLLDIYADMEQHLGLLVDKKI